jgi:hypothetical protein
MSSQQIYAEQELSIRSRKVLVEGGFIDSNFTGPIRWTLPNLNDFTVNTKRILTSDDLSSVASTVAIGTTTTLVAGSSATVSNVGTPTAAILNFGIPAGPNGLNGTNGTNGVNGSPGTPGLAATIAAGTAVSLSPGSAPTVTNTGTASAAVFNFGIPQASVAQFLCYHTWRNLQGNTAIGDGDPLTGFWQGGFASVAAFNLATGVFTAPATGHYLVQCSIWSAGTGVRWLLRRAGVGILQTASLQSGSGSNARIDYIVQLNVGQTCDIINYNGSSVDVVGRPNNAPESGVGTVISFTRVL